MTEEKKKRKSRKKKEIERVAEKVMAQVSSNLAPRNKFQRVNGLREILDRICKLESEIEKLKNDEKFS